MVGVERWELTADSPCVFMGALMFNVSRSLMPSVKEAPEHVHVHVHVCVCECKMGRIRGFDVSVSLSFSPKTPSLFLRTFFCCRYLNLTHKTATLFLLLTLPFSLFSLSHPV